MSKKLLMMTLVLGLVINASGCTGGEPKREEVVVKVKTENPADESVLKEEDKEDSMIAEEDLVVFQLAQESIKNYFDYEIDATDFSYEGLVGMENFWIVRLPIPDNTFQVRIAKEEEHVFNIMSYQYAYNNFREENKTFFEENVAMSDVIEYRYSKTPINEKAAKEVAEAFIASTPLADMKLKSVESFFEFKYDSSEKEYFVFEYLRTNENGLSKMISIKIDAYMKSVVEVSL